MSGIWSYTEGDFFHFFVFLVEVPNIPKFKADWLICLEQKSLCSHWRSIDFLHFLKKDDKIDRRRQAGWLRGEWQLPDLLYPHGYPFLSHLPLVFFESKGLFYPLKCIFPCIAAAKPQAILLIPTSLLVIWGPNQDTAGITTHGSSWSGTDKCAKCYHRPPSLQFTQFIPVKQELQERSNTKTFV